MPLKKCNGIYQDSSYVEDSNSELGGVQYSDSEHINNIVPELLFLEQNSS